MRSCNLLWIALCFLPTAGWAADPAPAPAAASAQVSAPPLTAPAAPAPAAPTLAAAPVSAAAPAKVPALAPAASAPTQTAAAAPPATAPAQTAAAAPAANLPPGPVPDLEAAKAALAGEVLDATGVRGELIELGALVSITLQYYLGKNPDSIQAKTFDDLVVVAEQAYDGKVIYETLQKAIADEVDERTLTAILDWYKSDPGKRFHTFETANGHSAALRDLPTFLGMSDLGQLDGQRLQAAHALDRAMFLSDDQLNIVMDVYRGARSGLNEYLPKSTRLSKSDLDQELSRVRLSFRDMVVKAVLGGVVTTFQQIPLEDLGAYTAFARKPEFQTLNRRIAKVLTRELDKAALKAERDIAKYKPETQDTKARALAGVATH